jgi:pimeloyl-ACP methyl ester carboxylesterase
MSTDSMPPEAPADKSTNVRSDGRAAARVAAERPERLPARLLLARAALAVGTTLSPTLAARWAEALFFTPPRPSKARRGMPPGARRLDVATASGSVAVWSWGKGPAVYLVHGWGGRAEQLGAFVEPLLARGFRVVALDGPGHGLSAGRRSSGPEMARALAAVVAHVAPAYAVIAHSLGAAAVVYAIREGLRVERLAFIGPPADPLVWVDAFARRLGLSTSVVAEMRRRSERRIGARWDEIPIVPLRGVGQAVPLLVVHDREDREVAWTDGAAVAEAWPGARLLETTGLGHRRVLRDGAVVDAVATFMAAETDPCAHGRRLAPTYCEACALEAELWAPDLRRHAPAALPAQH